MSVVLNVAILASGNGSNAENIMSSFKNESTVRVVCVISDQEGSFVLQRSKKFSIPCYCVSKISGESKISHECRIVELIRNQGGDFVLLAGYMRVLSSYFIGEFWNHKLSRANIINIHPSLLPKYPGMNSYKRAYLDRANSGVSVHYVDSGVDTGEIILQETFDYSDCDTFEAYEQKGRTIEVRLYPKALKIIHEELVSCQLHE